MKRLGIWIGILLGALLLVGLLHCFVCSSYLMLSSDMGEALLPGERVVVNKWSYGLRTPFTSLFGYHRWNEKPVCRGDIAVFNNPVDRSHALDSREIFAYRCMALPGDTISIDNYHLIVPRQGTPVAVDKHNITLLCNTILLHEGKKALVRHDSLFVDGKAVHVYTFAQDYYWMSSDGAGNIAASRYFGFVPADHLIGRAAFIWFSKDSRQDVFHCYRWHRFFSLVK
jgi:signal peptidase I